MDNEQKSKSKGQDKYAKQIIKLTETKFVKTKGKRIRTQNDEQGWIWERGPRIQTSKLNLMRGN